MPVPPSLFPAGYAPGARPEGALRTREPMARHTVWAVGGAAERFYEPAGLEDLAHFLARLPASEPLLWLGLGSNLLVRDGGVAGTVVATGTLRDAPVLAAAGVVRAGAGIPCAKVARFCARQGLQGAEFLAGIPGTLGGALAMNAGAFGGETWAIVQRVETIDRHGVKRLRPVADYAVGYREVAGPPAEWFVAAELVLSPGGGEAALERIRMLLRRRNATQPTGQRSCGSVFRNPPGDYAGRLIETAGLKGLRIGGAEVSRKHANFIINTGSATAADIEALIDAVRTAVAAHHGVRLVPEVHIVGRRRPSEPPGAGRADAAAGEASRTEERP